MLDSVRASTLPSRYHRCHSSPRRAPPGIAARARTARARAPLANWWRAAGGCDDQRATVRLASGRRTACRARCAAPRAQSSDVLGGGHNVHVRAIAVVARHDSRRGRRASANRRRSAALQSAVRRACRCRCRLEPRLRRLAPPAPRPAAAPSPPCLPPAARALGRPVRRATARRRACRSLRSAPPRRRAAARTRTRRAQAAQRRRGLLPCPLAACRPRAPARRVCRSAAAAAAAPPASLPRAARR